MVSSRIIWGKNANPGGARPNHGWDSHDARITITKSRTKVLPKRLGNRPVYRRGEGGPDASNAERAEPISPQGLAQESEHHLTACPPRPTAQARGRAGVKTGHDQAGAPLEHGRGTPAARLRGIDRQVCG